MTTQPVQTMLYGAGRVLPRLAPAGPADYNAAAGLFAALHQHNAALDRRFALADDWERLFREHFERTVGDPGALWLLAWHGQQPAGLLLMEAHHDSPLFRERHWAELVALYVAPEYRSAGLARRLVRTAYAWAAEHGFDRIQLYVTACNDGARGFYRRSGFRPTQEIWRCDVRPVRGARQPDDPSCTAAMQEGADLLQSGHHHLAMETQQHENDGNA